MLEIIYAMLLRFRIIPSAFIFMSILGIIILTFIITLDDDSDVIKFSTIRKKLFFITMLWLPFYCIPSPDNLFKIRLGLIKHEAISRENIEIFSTKGLPELNRIIKKFECKWLECEVDGNKK